MLSPDDELRFQNLVKEARANKRFPRLKEVLGNPETMGEARAAWESLPEFDGNLEVDRLRLEVEFLGEPTWPGEGGADEAP
jgi:hypothetical protein